MAQSIEYYISKGFDYKMAEYFASGRKKIVDVTPNTDFTLTLTFDNKEVRIYDCKPLLIKGTVFETFIDYNNFKRVYLDNDRCVSWDIDPNIDSNIVWNNKVDICPDTCYVDSVPIGGNNNA